MSEQPERMERWAIQYEDGEICTSSSFEEAKKWDGDEATLKLCRLVELREGESIVGPLEMAVIEAAKAQAEAWPAALAALEATTQTSAPFVRWERLAHATEAAVRALREARR